MISLGGSRRHQRLRRGLTSSRNTSCRCGSGLSFFPSYFGGHHWEIADHIVDISPIFRADRIHTPTLVMTGDQDRAVGPTNSWSLDRALQHLACPCDSSSFPASPTCCSSRPISAEEDLSQMAMRQLHEGSDDD